MSIPERNSSQGVNCGIIMITFNFICREPDERGADPGVGGVRAQDEQGGHRGRLRAAGPHPHPGERLRHGLLV